MNRVSQETKESREQDWKKSEEEKDSGKAKGRTIYNHNYSYWARVVQMKRKGEKKGSNRGMLASPKW